MSVSSLLKLADVLFLQGKEDLDQQSVPPAIAAEYDEALTNLRNKLMALEITLVDQLEVRYLLQLLM